MPFPATVFKVMIGSPSDVAKERKLIPGILHDWNDRNAEKEQLALIPKLWEKNSAPQLGDRAQAFINHHLVDPSDILIAVFWSRFGSDTGKEPSGTVEEIKEFMKAGKLVMLYFCDRAIPRKMIDHEQLRKLEAFKAEVQTLGIYYTYSSIANLREVLPRHLTTHIDMLKAKLPSKKTT